MIYNHDEYLKLSSPHVLKKIFELMKQEENDEGVIVREPYSGKLNLSLKFDISSPFELKNEIITFSDITQEFLITDMLNDIFK